MKKTQNVFRIYTRKNRKYAIWGCVFSFFSVIMLLTLMQTVQMFIDSVSSSSGVITETTSEMWVFLSSWTGSADTYYIVFVLSITFVVVSLCKSLCNWGANQCFYGYAHRSRSALRKAVFKKLAFMNKNVDTKLIFFNATSDVDDYSDVLYKHCPKMLDSLFRIIFASILCLLIAFQISFAFLIFVPIMFLFGLILRRKIVPSFSEARNRKSDMFSACEEIVGNVKEVKAFGNENFAIRAYNKQNDIHTKSITNSNNILNYNKFWLNFIRAVAIFAAFCVCGFACLKGLISLGFFALLISLVFIIFDASVNFMSSYYNAKVSAISARRLNSFLDAHSSIKPSKMLAPKKFDISINNLCVKLNGESNVFNNLNMSIPFGTHTEIIVKQGQGKTTLSRVLLRFLPLSSGEILFNDTNIAKIDISSYRKSFSYVPQQPAIFEGTLKDNILMFSKLNKQKLNKVIEICELNNLIKTFPNGLEQILTENGKNLPIQECQKIALARALYRNAPVLLMDSCFKKFNPAVKEHLLKKVLKFYKGKTVIYFTDDFSTIELFDKTITIKNGGQK